MKAEQFSDAIEVVRGWLPDAEAELKFQSIPEDEDSIMQLIENHEVRAC
jgi:dystonin